MKLIAIVGKPNVGKSTFFNRLAKRRIAITSPEPGATRDRNMAIIHNRGYHFMLMDTGGFEPDIKEGIPSKMREQSQLAVEEADVIIFMLDRIQGFTPQDRDIYEFLRRSGKPLYVAVNKVDGDNHEQHLAEFWEAGVSDIYPISSEHGRGIWDLFEQIGEDYPALHEEEDRVDEDEIAVAIVGRPNAGKSSLTNYFLGHKKQIVHDEPGTTRDPIDNFLTFQKQKVRLIDTAGIRKKSRVSLTIDHYSMVAALKSVERSDVAVLVIDATEGVVEQDARIAGLIQDRGKAMVIAVNKWDLVVEKTSTSLEKLREDIYDQLEFVKYAPMVFVSAETGQRVPTILETAIEVYGEFTKRIQTSDLNSILESITARHSPPAKGGQVSKIYYASQVATRPPTFVLNCNNPNKINTSYRRFMANQFRQYFDFVGCPIRLIWRDRGGKKDDT